MCGYNLGQICRGIWTNSAINRIYLTNSEDRYCVYIVKACSVHVVGYELRFRMSCECRQTWSPKASRKLFASFYSTDTCSDTHISHDTVYSPWSSTDPYQLINSAWQCVVFSDMVTLPSSMTTGARRPNQHLSSTKFYGVFFALRYAWIAPFESETDGKAALDIE